MFYWVTTGEKDQTHVRVYYTYVTSKLDNIIGNWVSFGDTVISEVYGLVSPNFV